MKKIVILLGVSALILSFGDSTQNSFSQRAKSSQPSVYKKPPLSQDGKEQQFVKDTSYLNKLITQTMDSLRIENEKTNARIEVKKETIKVQKANERDLSQISSILNRGLDRATKEAPVMPPVRVIENKTKAKPLDVNIESPSPDTLSIPVHKKKFFDFLRFWK